MVDETSHISWPLIEKPWIMILNHDGSQGEVSLYEVLERAHEIKEITGDIPQQVGPIYRFLDAIVRRAFFGEKLTYREAKDKWLDLWRRGSFDMTILGRYLHAHAEGFDLFGEHPFYQVPNLEYDAAKEFDPAVGLIADVPTKDEKFLFSQRGKKAPARISFAEAARWLIFCQCYDPAGIKTPVKGNTFKKEGKAYAPKGIPATGYLGNLGLTVIEGLNLFETIMWNLALYDPADPDVRLFGVEDDLPPWELPVPLSNMEVLPEPTGLVQLETMQSRRLRLVPSEDGEAVVGYIACYGDMVHPVDAMSYETMTAKKQSKPQQKRLGLPVAPFMPRPHDTRKAMWRGLSGLLAASDGLPNGMDDRPGVVRWMNAMCDALAENGEEIDCFLPKSVTLRGQGIEYGTQSSVYVDGYDDRLVVGSALAVDDEEAVSCALDLAKNVNLALKEVANLVCGIEKSKGNRALNNNAEARQEDVITAAASEVDDLFRLYLADMTGDVDPYEHTAHWASKLRSRFIQIGSSVCESSDALMFGAHTGWTLAHAKAHFFNRINGLLSTDC